MLTSTKVGLGSLATCAVLNFFKVQYGPKIDLYDESSVVIMSGPMYTLWQLVQLVGSFLLFVGLVALLVAALTKLKVLPREY